MDFIAFINLIGDTLYLIAYTIITKAIYVYLYLTKRFYLHHLHLEVQIRKWGISVQGWNHENFLIHKREHLLQLKRYLPPLEYIETIFKECKHCDILVFDCGQKQKFVQFWHGDGSLFCSWPILKGNDLKPYTYAMLGVLNELGITKNHINHKIPKKASPYYSFMKFEKFEAYAFNFGNDIQTAAKFTHTIFAEVFQQDLKKLRFRIE